MKKSIMILIMVTAGFFSCGQISTDSVYTGTLDSVKAEVVSQPNKFVNNVPDSLYQVG